MVRAQMTQQYWVCLQVVKKVGNGMDFDDAYAEVMRSVRDMEGSIVWSDPQETSKEV